MVERIQLLRRLEKVIEETDFAWSLCMVGEDQSRKLADLTSDLKRPPSATGDGKKIVSGYSYWGIEPAIAWQHACTDPYYPVMKEGVGSFGRRWRNMQTDLKDQGYHYFSLGPGTGEKDRMVLNDLQPRNPDMLYVPVDMSAEMLRICLQPMNVLPFIRRFRNQMLPVQLDFSFEENVDELNELRTRLVGDEPVLFSLLGNTMANFVDDVDLVSRLSMQLLRPQDRLLLEVATTSHLNLETARSAAREYEASKAFGEFVTSALHQHTDLSVDIESLVYDGTIDDDTSILIKILYKNNTGETIRMTLPDRNVVAFPPDDTIRVHITRKYERKALEVAFSAVGLTIESEAHTVLPARGNAYRFGLALMLVGHTDPKKRLSSAARDLFRNPGR